MERSCSDCKHWWPERGEKTRRGECRRHPPVAIARADQEIIRWRFAISLGRDWCSEWAERAKRPAKDCALLAAGFSTRIVNVVLEFLEVQYVSELANCTAADLLTLPGLGRTSVREIRRRLADSGLFLRGEAGVALSNDARR